MKDWRRLMGRGLYAQMSPAMITEADKVAHWRQNNAVDEDRIPGNNLAVGRDVELQLNIRGTRGERAGKVFFEPIKWHAYKTGDLGGLPDLGNFIDVKTVPEHRVSLLIVKRGGVVARYAYMLVSAAAHPYYWFVGWIWGEDLLKVPLSQPQPGRWAHVVAEDSPLLQRPYLLQRIVEERRAAGNL